MAQVNFETAQQIEEVRPRGGLGSFEFFNLKNDGDQAVVRFMYKDLSDFDIFTVHNVTINGKYRKVSCIRDPHDATEACPLCASGNSISNRFYIKMIEYRVNDQGQVEIHPVVWERSMSYASKLKSMLEEYGPLEDCLFKVKRNGAAGSMDTTYDIMFCSPKVYSDETYPKIEDAFKDTKFLGTIVLDKTYAEIETFLATGAFPATTQPQASAPANVAPPQYTPKVDVNVQYEAPITQQPYVTPAVPNIPQAPAAPTSVVQTQMPPVGPQTTAAPSRPVRYY